jgi:hypothetical protein
MQTKLTLRLDQTLIEQAKAHAKQSGKSLSQMVADYFAQLDQPGGSQELPPVTRSLRGALKSAEASEQDYHAYLEEKYR